MDILDYLLEVSSGQGSVFQHTFHYGACRGAQRLSYNGRQLDHGVKDCQLLRLTSFGCFELAHSVVSSSVHVLAIQDTELHSPTAFAGWLLLGEVFCNELCLVFGQALSENLLGLRINAHGSE